MYKYSGNSLLGHKECVIVLITRESSFQGLARQRYLLMTTKFVIRKML